MKRRKSHVMVFENLYSPYLYVTSFDHVDEANEMFEFYDDVDEMIHEKDSSYTITKGVLSRAEALTLCVKEKRTGAMGALIMIKDKNISNGTKAHESVHAADVYYSFGKFTSQSYHDGNEPYAYLVGWITDCIDEFIKCEYGDDTLEKLDRAIARKVNRMNKLLDDIQN